MTAASTQRGQGSVLWVIQSKARQSQTCSKNQGKTRHCNPDGANSRFGKVGTDRVARCSDSPKRQLPAQGGHEGLQRLPRIYCFCL